MAVTTRFAPSPTGYLHVGGARTALFSWLYAKKHQGEFILRIEDTDRERSTDAAVSAILNGMKWLGLASTQGPFFQTERMDRYHEVINELLASGHAYRCYCTKERLESLRESQMANKLKPRYDGHCRDNSSNDVGAPHVIRFKTPKDGAIVFKDHIRGELNVQNHELDDLVIARTDGTPTYNLCVVVDDLDMGVTHVIRGDDHINNTPRQINILKALGASIPQYAHVPMILGEDGKRLSKRHGAVSVLEYQRAGYLPQALLNYLVRLGWSHGDQEIFSLDEMCELFNLDSISHSPAAFNHDKLNWLNQHYIKTLPTEVVSQELNYQYQSLDIDVANGPSLAMVIEAFGERVNTLKEMAEKSRFCFEDFETFDANAAKKHLRPVVLEPLKALLAELEAATDWSKEALNAIVHDIADKFELKLPKLGQPLRVAVTGNGMSPSIDVTLALVGQDKTVQRLSKAVVFIEERQSFS